MTTLILIPACAMLIALVVAIDMWLISRKERKWTKRRRRPLVDLFPPTGASNE